MKGKVVVSEVNVKNIQRPAPRIQRGLVQARAERGPDSLQLSASRSAVQAT